MRLIWKHLIIFHFDSVLQSRDFGDNDFMNEESFKRWKDSAWKNMGVSIIEKEVSLFVDMQTMDCDTEYGL